MISAILDTNIVVQSVISSPVCASARVLDAYYDGAFRFLYSTATLDELIDVLCVARIRDRHGLSDDEVLEFVASLLVVSDRYPGSVQLSFALTRDVTDTKFLALAEESRADYLVTNDRRHLLPLRRFHETRIVTPTQFLRALRSRSEG